MTVPVWHRTGGNWLENWTPDKVANANDPVLAFAAYASQVLGVPFATVKDQQVLRKRIKELFAHYPRADFYTLCRVVQFAKSKRKRFPRVYMVVDEFRQAYKAGVLPELDPDHPDPRVEDKITKILEFETDENWRARLILAAGNEARRAVVIEWQERNRR